MSSKSCPNPRVDGSARVAANSEVIQMVQTEIRQATGSDEIRPIIHPWPLPPPRPKRAASGVAGLRYGSGQGKTNHALMSETSAGNLSPKLFHLTYK
jgi:hypothetical protein